MTTFEIEKTSCFSNGGISTPSTSNLIVLHGSATGDITTGDRPWLGISKTWARSGWVAQHSGRILKGSVSGATSANATPPTLIQAQVIKNGITLGGTNFAFNHTFATPIEFVAGDSIGIRAASTVTLGGTGTSSASYLIEIDLL